MVKRVISCMIAGICLWSLWTFFSLPSSTAQEISAANTSRYLGDGKWDWTVFIKASPEVLNQVKCVEYTLHPTFTKRFISVCELGNKDCPFGYHAKGWGTFEIPVKITFKNGTSSFQKHMLTFTAPDVKKEPLHFTADNVATQVREGLWDWTVFIQGPDDALDQIQCVKYTLHPTFPNPEREVCKRGTGEHAFALSSRGWGTFSINIRIFLKNGQVQELRHKLKF